VLHALIVSVALAMVIGGCGKHRNPIGVDLGTHGSLSLKNSRDLAMVLRTQNLHTHELLSIHGVVGTGVGAAPDGRAAIYVLTDRAGVRPVDNIDGIPVVTRYVGTVVALAAKGAGPTATPAAALLMGTSTGNDKECAAGTLGCVVVKGTARYFLSNNHVFARENAAANGERIDAPGRYDGKPRCSQTPQIATLSSFQAISFNSNNTIDAAIAQPVNGLAFSCAEKGGYTPSATVVSPVVGLAVKKSGRTSGVTHGSIAAINVTVRVQYSAGVATFVNQIMVNGSFIRSGDSGSLMVTETDSNPVGLCFAGGSGSSFANPIGPVLQKFGATVCNQ
jgi:hypothetical protein